VIEEFERDLIRERTIAGREAAPLLPIKAKAVTSASTPLRSSFGYYRTLPTDRGDNRIWGQTPLPMPVLGVGAEWGYGAASARTIRQVVTDVKEVLIERCGHYVPEERPVELAGAITDFLIKYRPRALTMFT
jgi:hypothetical protein